MVVAEYDAVVIGSGFGGSVTACRLAEASLSVCLLERGRRYPPGSFPRTPREMGRNLWDPIRGMYGLFEVWAFRGKLWSLVSSGLGGGSLIYAATLHRKDASWFVQEDPARGGEYWPLTRAELEPHYERVERMLGAQIYPFETHAPYSATPKTRQLKLAAERLGLEWHLPKLAISFTREGEDAEPAVGAPIGGPENLHQAPRFTCRLCGECNLGCNFGSKNSLDFNYLTRAWQHGAEIKTLCEAREIAPRPGGGYLIRYVERRPGGPDGVDDDLPADLHRETMVEIGAERLILSAGTFGTTELLLRNRRHFPRLSPMLGRRFSGNGNLLTFAVNARERQGAQVRPRVLEPAFGPVITSAVRVPDSVEDGDGRGFYIEDAGYPVFLDWMLEVTRPGLLARLLRLVGRRAWTRLSPDPRSNLSGAVAAALGSGARSASSLPLLGIGRDVPSGVISLRRGRLDVDWDRRASQDYFARVRTTARAIAEVWRADFHGNPLRGLGQGVTVHPLGGCSMGRSAAEGVVDAYGRVFNYPGLYVADGSVMPGPVGPNPALTIAALAERCAERIIETADRAGAARALDEMANSCPR